MIVLDEEHYIAEGHTQKCYKHPEHKNLFIKIVKYNPSSGSRNIHEIDYYEKYDTIRYSATLQYWM